MVIGVLIRQHPIGLQPVKKDLGRHQGPPVGALIG
jgi:hypothetical protein